MKYAYFPGCVGQDSCSELDVSTKLIAEELGLELVELTDATCSGAGFLQDVDYDLSLVLNARTFAMAEKLGLDILTVCSTCQFNLDRANQELKESPEKLAEVNGMLAEIGMKYNGTVAVKHILWVLVDEVGLGNLRGRVKADLSDLNVASFYGCQLIRPGDLRAMAAPIDFLGINYYTRAIIRDVYAPDNLPVSVRPEPHATEMGWEVHPDSLHDLLVRLHVDYHPPKLYITENGASYSDGPDADGRIHDQRRLDYVRDHLRAVHRAIQGGVPVQGYFIWSLLDNFEWARGYRQRFGIVWVDYATQQRLPKDSALWYREVIRRNGV